MVIQTAVVKLGLLVVCADQVLGQVLGGECRSLMSSLPLGDAPDYIEKVCDRYATSAASNDLVANVSRILCDPSRYFWLLSKIALGILLMFSPIYLNGCHSEWHWSSFLLSLHNECSILVTF